MYSHQRNHLTGHALFNKDESIKKESPLAEVPEVEQRKLKGVSPSDDKRPRPERNKRLFRTAREWRRRFNYPRSVTVKTAHIIERLIDFKWDSSSSPGFHVWNLSKLPRYVSLPRIEEEHVPRVILIAHEGTLNLLGI